MSELKLRPPSFLPFQRVHQVQRTVPEGRCAPWAEAQGLQSPIFRAALMSELKLRPPSFLPFQRVHQVQRTVPQGRCAGPGLKPRVYSLCFLGPFCGTAEAVPSYLSQMETAHQDQAKRKARVLTGLRHR